MRTIKQKHPALYSVLFALLIVAVCVTLLFFSFTWQDESHDTQTKGMVKIAYKADQPACDVETTYCIAWKDV